jgi:site-specific recombinase XerD
VPRKPHEDVRPWSADERQRIRDAAAVLDRVADGQGLPRRRLVEVLFGMGLRIQEAAAAHWEWINRRARTIRVAEQIARRTNQPKRLKDSKARTAVVLQEWWDHHLGDAAGLIVADESGRPVRHRRLHDYVAEILVTAGVKQRGKAAHQFRHTYAFLFLQRGGSMEQLQKALGHAKISTTQEYYDHFTSDHAARAGVRAIYRARRGPRG